MFSFSAFQKLPFASECDLKPAVDQNVPMMSYDHTGDYDQRNVPPFPYPVVDTSLPPPGYPPHPSDQNVGHQMSQDVPQKSPLEEGEQADSELEYPDRDM